MITCIFLISSFDLNAIKIIHSHAFKLNVTNCPVTFETIRCFCVLGAVSCIIENIPQLFLSYLALERDMDVSTMLVFSVTLLDLLYGVSTLFMWIAVGEQRFSQNLKMTPQPGAQ